MRRPTEQLIVKRDISEKIVYFHCTKLSLWQDNRSTNVEYLLPLFINIMNVVHAEKIKLVFYDIE